MLKRLSIALLSLLSTLFVAAVAGSVYNAFFSHHWADMEPWFGAEPDIISSKHGEYGSEWMVKADRARLQQIAETMHAEPCSLGAKQVGYATAHPIRLRYVDGTTHTLLHHLRITGYHDGTARLEWLTADTEAGTKAVDVTAPVSMPRFLSLSRNDWRELAWKIFLFGPTLLTDAWLLFLPPSKRRRLLWYLLPLLHALYLMGFLYLLHQEEWECACDELPLLLPLLTWCAFSLLQSAIADAAVALIHYTRSRHA